MALTEIAFCSVQFDRTVLYTVEAMSPRLLLASFNASLVGICCNERSDILQEIPLYLRYGDRRFQLHFLAPSSINPLLPLHDVGIIRAVDIRANHFLLICPTPPPLNGGNGVVFIKSTTPLPLLLTYSPRQLCYPYLSSEVEGEGCRRMKARTNVKRKWQSTV